MNDNCINQNNPLTQSSDILVKLVSFTSVSMTLLGGYRSILPGFNWGTFLILSCFLISLVVKTRIVILRTPFIVLCGWILLISPVALAVYSETINMDTGNLIAALLRTYHFGIVLSIYFIFGLYSFFDTHLAIKYMRAIVYFNTLLIVIQQIVNIVFHYPIQNPFTNFAMTSYYFTENYSSVMGNGLFRPSGLFLEPSNVSQYYIIFLCVILFSSKNNKYDFRDLLITSIGILGTGSGMGVFIIASFALLAVCRRFKFNAMKSMAMLLVFAVAVIMVLQTDYVQKVLARIFTSSVDTGGNAILSRFGNGFDFYFGLGIGQKLMGCGFIAWDFFLNGVEYILNTMGAIGLTVFFAIYMRLLTMAKDYWRKMVVLSYGALFLVSQFFNAGTIILYFSMALSVDYIDYIEVFSSKRLIRIRA